MLFAGTRFRAVLVCMRHVMMQTVMCPVVWYDDHLSVINICIQIYTDTDK